MRQELRPLLVLITILAMVATIDRPVFAHTNRGVDKIFRMLDTNSDGKVSRTEYDLNKMNVIYRDLRIDPMPGLTFKQTGVSRKFFDSADVDHDGRLSPVELIDAFPFDAIDYGNRGYLELEDLRRFIKLIGR